MTSTIKAVEKIWVIGGIKDEPSNGDLEFCQHYWSGGGPSTPLPNREQKQQGCTPVRLPAHESEWEQRLDDKIETIMENLYRQVGKPGGQPLMWIENQYQSLKTEAIKFFGGHESP